MTSHAALRRDSSWCIPLLSSGEISVEQKMAEAKRSIMPGQAIRLLHIVADNRTHGAFDVLYDTDVPAVFAERINTSAGACFGTAGPEFVKRLIAAIKTTDVRAMVKRMSASFAEKLSKNHDLTTDGQVARALKRFALIGAAGEIATQFGITGWSRGEAMRAAAEGFRLWIDERGHVRSHEIKGTIGRVRAYLREYGSNRFATQIVPIVAVQDGWRHDDLFLLSPETWTKLHGKEGMEDAAKRLKASGFLRTDSGKGLQYRGPSWIHGSHNRPRTYAVRASILDHASLIETTSGAPEPAS